MLNFQLFPHPLPPAQQRKGDKAIPMFDPKTRKNVVNDKNCDETVTRPNMDKEVSLPSKTVETARVPNSQTVLHPCEKETIRVEETVDMELVERAELAEAESLNKYIGIIHLMAC
ncbi:hypothetical protein TNCV_4980361 [Trichonephila clavipes]|nr:hypothetical protein TNCV_4980361 [Trichonephila clavipes]